MSERRTAKPNGSSALVGKLHEEQDGTCGVRGTGVLSQLSLNGGWRAGRRLFLFPAMSVKVVSEKLKKAERRKDPAVHGGRRCIRVPIRTAKR
jgi:hypothetical protein